MMTFGLHWPRIAPFSTANACQKLGRFQVSSNLFSLLTLVNRGVFSSRVQISSSSGYQQQCQWPVGASGTVLTNNSQNDIPLALGILFNNLWLLGTGLSTHADYPSMKRFPYFYLLVWCGLDVTL